MLTRPRRLATWLGAGVIIVVGAPIAYATDGGVPSHVPTPAPTPIGHPARPDVGGLRAAPYPTVGYLQARNGDVLTVLYRDAALSRVMIGSGMAGQAPAGHPAPGI